MIKIKIRDETTAFAHYGVSAKNGAPGRGSGRYPLGSGANPRSENNKYIGNDKRGFLFGKNKAEKDIGESNLKTTLQMSDEDTKPIRTITKAQSKQYIKENPKRFPWGPVINDKYNDDGYKEYKKQRDKYCAKDEKTGLYLDKPAEGVSQELFDEYREWRNKNKRPADNIEGPLWEGRSYNDTVAAMAHDLNIKGYDVTAKALYDPQLPESFHHAYKNAGDINVYNNIKGAVNDIIKQGAGASGALMVTDGKKYKYTLVYSVVNDNGSEKAIISSTRAYTPTETACSISDGNLTVTGSYGNYILEDVNKRNSPELSVVRLDQAKPNPSAMYKYVG